MAIISPSRFQIFILTYFHLWIVNWFGPSECIPICINCLKCIPLLWKKIINTFTWLLGNAEVRRVSCVSSMSFRLGMLNMKAAWSAVAAVEVILYPLSHRLWIPSLGYRKSNSTTCIENHKKKWKILELGWRWMENLAPGQQHNRLGSSFQELNLHSIANLYEVKP